MSQIIPLQLPLLVEQKRKGAIPQNDWAGDLTETTYTIDSAPSGAVSPVTPTFSAHGHIRGSSSTSSLEILTPASSQGPPSPVQLTHQSGKRILPNVQELEEPIEVRDSYIDDSASDQFDLCDCFCDETCIHQDSELVQSTPDFYTPTEEIDYDFGGRSDGDLRADSKAFRKPRGVAGIAQRIESRFPPLKRWKSKSRQRAASVTTSPISEFGFEQALSRAASSRSSSISVSHRWQQDRMNEPPLPPTPARSFFESCESVAMSTPIDIDRANSLDAVTIERERALAPTPLLPPVMNSPSRNVSSTAPSPLESPTIASYVTPDPCSPLPLSPALSTKPSIASFHHATLSTELPNIPEPDKWSYRLGHANFTITPEPYKPDIANVDSLRQLRSDWESARISYTKHLARTVEHYSLTSKTYAFTEAKWAEIDGVWRKNHDEVAAVVIASGEISSLDNFDEVVDTTVPLMDRKFPDRGDVDIVGPMVREATMSCDGCDKRMPGFWRNLAGRVGIRK